MAIEVKTLEAKDVQSNQLNLCGELTNAGNYDAVIAYFMYSKDENLNEAYKSDKCALIDDPDTYELIQDNIDDNIYYYYKAVAENYEMTETQLNHIENLSYLNISADKFSNQFFVNTVLASPNAFTEFFMNKNYVQSAWNQNNLDLLFERDDNITEINSNNISSITERYDTDNYDIISNQKIDFSKLETINLDLETSISGEGFSISIEDENIYSTSGTFDRKTVSIDITNINTLSELKMTHNAGKYEQAQIYIYGVWGE